MRHLLTALCASLLAAEPALACVNAMEESGPDPRKILVVVALVAGLVAAIALFVQSRSKARAAEQAERFKNLDAEA